MATRRGGRPVGAPKTMAMTSVPSARAVLVCSSHVIRGVLEVRVGSTACSWSPRATRGFSCPTRIMVSGRRRHAASGLQVHRCLDCCAQRKAMVALAGCGALSHKGVRVGRRLGFGRDPLFSHWHKSMRACTAIIPICLQCAELKRPC